jgi:hypothetical protein
MQGIIGGANHFGMSYGQGQFGQFGQFGGGMAGGPAQAAAAAAARAVAGAAKAAAGVGGVGGVPVKRGRGRPRGSTNKNKAKKKKKPNLSIQTKEQTGPGRLIQNVLGAPGGAARFSLRLEPSPHTMAAFRKHVAEGMNGISSNGWGGAQVTFSGVPGYSPWGRSASATSAVAGAANVQQYHGQMNGNVGPLSTRNSVNVAALAAATAAAAAARAAVAAAVAAGVGGADAMSNGSPGALSNNPIAFKDGASLGGSKAGKIGDANLGRRGKFQVPQPVSTNNLVLDTNVPQLPTPTVTTRPESTLYRDGLHFDFSEDLRGVSPRSEL